MIRANAASATPQSDAFVRVVRLVAFLGGRTPRRPLAREARAFASLRRQDRADGAFSLRVRIGRGIHGQAGT